jgi:hypothetical protein
VIALDTANQPPRGGIRKSPFSPVETTPVIDHNRHESVVFRPSHKNRLAVVDIGCPFVEDKHSEEVTQIADPPPNKIGKNAVAQISLSVDISDEA